MTNLIITWIDSKPTELNGELRIKQSCVYGRLYEIYFPAIDNAAISSNLVKFYILNWNPMYWTNVYDDQDMSSQYLIIEYYYRQDCCPWLCLSAAS